MEIQNLFMGFIWLCGFLVLCTGALWMLKAIWDSLLLIKGKTGEKNAVDSIIEEINDININANAFSEKSFDETED